MTATTGTCLAQTDLSGNSLPLITSYDIYGTNYIDKAIRFEGRVLDVFKDEMNPHYFFALVEDAYGKVYLAVRMRHQPTYQFDSLLGARISVDGKCTCKFIYGVRPYLGRQIDIQASDISVLSPSLDDPFTAPLTTKTEDIPPERLVELGRRRMFGRVLAIRHSDTMLIQSEDNSISRIELRNPAPPAIGDTVEVVGNVETDLHHMNLSRAIWRPAQPWSESDNDATNVTARLLFQDGDVQAVINRSFHGRKVRMRGIVRSLPVQDFPEKTFVIDCEGVPLTCDASALSGKTTSLEIGCLVEIEGICWMEIENWRPGAVFPMSRGYTLVLQNEDGLKIIARPPWWTPARLLAVIGALLAALLLFGVWNRMLRKLAERRGRDLFREQATRMKAEFKTIERSRLAVELHDSISQVLTAVALKIKAVQAQAPTDLDKALRNLDIAESTLRSSREELRYCLWDLRNNILDLPNLEEAIRQTLKPQIGDAGLVVRFPVSRRNLSDNTIHVVLSIIRELSVNAIRHGEAKTIHIAGSLDSGILAFSVQDDGQGFDPSQAPGPEQGHFGLLGIKDRIAHYNGTIEIASAPGKGTKAKVRLAVDAEMETEMS